jgi:HAE1 family hydrophobic/amphiphilic exporter-1/multidrug efflux pump
LDSLINKIVQTVGLNLYVCQNSKGDLIQMDNIVSIEEQAPQLYHNNRFMAATVSAGLASGKSINDGIEAMEKIKTKILDDTFTTD